MTNPSATTPGPDHLAASDTVKSSSGAVTLGPAKAWIGAILGALGAAVPLAINAIADGSVDLAEGWGILGALLVGGGIIGGGVWLTPTKVTVN